MNVLELIKEKGIEPKKAASTKGGEYHSSCPGCGGDDRFHVWPEQNSGEGSFWCRQCNKGGDAITFLMEFEGLDYPQACEKLDKNPNLVFFSRISKHIQLYPVGALKVIIKHGTGYLRGHFSFSELN